MWSLGDAGAAHAPTRFSQRSLGQPFGPPQAKLGRDSPRESEGPAARPPPRRRGAERRAPSCCLLASESANVRGPAARPGSQVAEAAAAASRGAAASARTVWERSGPGLPGPVGDRVAQVVGEQRRRSAGLGETARWCGPSAAAPKPLQHLSKCDNRCVTQAVAQQSQLLVISII